jgi:hypothetical protein
MKRRLGLVALLVLVGLGSLAGSAPRGRARAAVDPGNGWQAAATLFSATGGEFPRVGAPQVAIDGSRRATAVWLYASEHVLVESDWTEAGGWTQARTLTSLGTDVSSVEAPLLSVDQRGDALLAWIANQQLRVSYRTAGGEWQQPTTLSRPGERVAYPQIAIDDQGRALVMWLASPPFRLEVVSRGQTGVWGKPKVICACGATGALAMNANGHALVVWSQPGVTVQRNPFWAEMRSPSGRWSAAQRVSSLNNYGAVPLLAVNSRGGAVVAWLAPGPGQGRLVVEIRGSRGRFERAQPIGDDPYWGYMLALSATGEATVVWHDRGGCLFSMSRLPGASSFSSPQTLACGSYGGNMPEALAMDAHGNTLALWLNADNASPARHMLLHYAERPAGGSFDNGADISDMGIDSYKHSACSGDARIAVTPDGTLALAIWAARPHEPGSCTQIQAATLAR